MEVFVDSGFYVALLDARDQHHQRALSHANALTRVQVTTRWVLAEVANSLAENRMRPEVALFVRKMETEPLVRIIGPRDSLFARGLNLYAQRPDKAWSLTDCISFVVMEQEGLQEALTRDHHFAQAGFIPVFADAT